MSTRPVHQLGFIHRTPRLVLGTALLALATMGGVSEACAADGAGAAADGDGAWLRSIKHGLWSDAATWEHGKVPGEGTRVFIVSGHRVTYDVNSDAVIRAVYVAGELEFSTDRDTRLDVGVIKVQPGETPSENGFDCEVHAEDLESLSVKPALRLGTPERPIAADKTAKIRLVYCAGHDQESCPAIVCCGGRMDFHGASMNRTWVKLGATVRPQETTLTLAEKVTGWRVGDRVIITATRLGRDLGQGLDKLETEERTIRAIDGERMELDQPLAREHLGEGEFRGEVANLSRNVIVESAAPDGVRGHTMYHRDSAGAISYAEFRHLGKRDTLGRYTLHFHQCGDTMRGSYVIGAAIHDSHNRWLTIHGTNHLIVRDCVGYRSIGHGYFLEDGTEVDNVLDRNLAVQALEGKKLPKQVLPFDHNDGAGFWWANCRNTFTRNVSCENGRYGYRYEATETSQLNLTLPIRQPNGVIREVDIRTQPFVRFEGNEAHCDGLYGINLGEGVNRVGPDARTPFILRDTKIWEIHYAFRPQAPNVLAENLTIHNSIYGVYHPNFDNHVYRNVIISRSGRSGDAEPFNRGHDDDSVQYGRLTVDGLIFSGHMNSGMPLIQLTDHNPTGKAQSHFRRVQVLDRRDENRRSLVNLGGGPRFDPKGPTSVPVFIHDYYGPGEHARVASARASDVKQASTGTYVSDPPLTGDESRVARVRDVEFPQLLEPRDEYPPTTVITHITRVEGGWLVRGTAADDGGITQVTVNGVAAKNLQTNFSEWQALLSRLPEDAPVVTASAVDQAGHNEALTHRVRVATGR